MKKILILLNILILFIIIATPSYAFTPVPSVNYSSLDDVTITNNVIRDLQWKLFDDGFWYLDYDGNAMLGNGLFDLNYSVRFQSTGRYKIMQFYDSYSGNYITFDFNFSIYYDFTIEYDVINDWFKITIDDENIGTITGLQYILKDAYIRMYDAEWVASNEDYLHYQEVQQSYGNGYNNGYNQGILDGGDLGYDNGYHDGQEDYYNGIYLEDEIGILFPSSESVAFGNGFSLGVLSETDFDFSQLLEYVFKPFEILNKTIAFDITFGHVALISIVFGLMGFLFSLKKGRK